MLSTIDAAKRSSAKEIIAIIPHLPHSRQERRIDGQRTPITAKLFANLLQTAGLNRLITVDVHTTAIEGFYDIPFDNINPFDIFIKIINNLNLDNYLIVSPDFGGMKRAKKYAKELNADLAFISKERLVANEISEMTLIGDVKNRNILIFDDMIDTGGTLDNAAKLLKLNGANKIIVFATHGIFSNNADSIIMERGNVDEIFVTNTLPPKKIVKNINYIDITPLIHKMITKTLKQD